MAVPEALTLAEQRANRLVELMGEASLVDKAIVGQAAPLLRQASILINQAEKVMSGMDNLELAELLLDLLDGGPTSTAVEVEGRIIGLDGRPATKH